MALEIKQLYGEWIVEISNERWLVPDTVVREVVELLMTWKDRYRPDRGGKADGPLPKTKKRK